MSLEEEQMIGQIMDTETVGYTYIFPKQGYWRRLHDCPDTREPG